MERFYVENNDLKKEDVENMLEWAEKQPHLPKISELQCAIFLHSCYYSNEKAKKTIDSFFTIKKHFPEMFDNRNPTSPKFQGPLKVGLYSILPKLTPDGNRVIFCKFIDCDPNKYVYVDELRLFDMICMLWLHQGDFPNGHIIVFDMQGMLFGHLAKISIIIVKKFFTYLQEAMPVRLKGLHMINVVPFIDKVMALIKPFMKKELMDVMHLHSKGVESLYKYVPQECLPNEYGGTAGTVSKLCDQQKKCILENADFFIEQEKQVVDESKRPGKPKNAGDIFGMEGTFKKLDID